MREDALLRRQNQVGIAKQVEIQTQPEEITRPDPRFKSHVRLLDRSARSVVQIYWSSLISLQWRS
jgi:hypothetical protein